MKPIKTYNVALSEDEIATIIRALRHEAVDLTVSEQEMVKDGDFRIADLFHEDWVIVSTLEEQFKEVLKS